MRKTVFGLSLILALVLMTVSPAFAEVGVTVQGTVDSVDLVAGTFNMTATDATVYTVTPPLGFDLTTLAVGDQVEVMGDTDDLGGLVATSVIELTETTLTGEIQSIDPDTCIFTILTSEGTTYTVMLPEGSDCSTLLVGDMVEVTGTLNEDGTFSASGVVVLPPEDDGDGDGDEPVNTGFFCSFPEFPHPALSMVANAHGADYATALSWFCGGGLGIGGVNMVLSMSQAFGMTPEEILAMRANMGWGQIKHLLASSGDEGGEEEDTGATTTTNSKGNGGGNGNGNGGGNGNDGNHGGGKPPWAGGGGNGQGKDHDK